MDANLMPPACLAALLPPQEQKTLQFAHEAGILLAESVAGGHVQWRILQPPSNFLISMLITVAKA